MREASFALAQELLSRSVLFEHDPREVSIWLDALPCYMSRASNASAPDGTPLTDEFKGVLSFLDDCILRCQKTPYRYLEEVLAMSFGTDPSARVPPSAPSPLLATILEQLGTKIAKNLISSSDTLAIITYMRKVLVGLVGKQPSVSCSIRIMEHVVGAFASFPSAGKSSSIAKALGRETRLLQRLLSALGSRNQAIHSTPMVATEEELNLFIDGLESAHASEHLMIYINFRRGSDVDLDLEPS